MAGVSFGGIQWDDGALHALLQGPSGDVAKDLARQGVKLTNQVKINCTQRPGPMVRTGRLRDSITMQMAEDGAGLYLDVGTNVEYAPYLEFGTSRMPPYPFLRPALEQFGYG